MASRKRMIAITVIGQRFREAKRVLIRHDMHHVRVDIIVDDFARRRGSLKSRFESVIGRHDDLSPIVLADLVTLTEEVGVFWCKLDGKDVEDDDGRGSEINQMLNLRDEDRREVIVEVDILCCVHGDFRWVGGIPVLASIELAAGLKRLSCNHEYYTYRMLLEVVLPDCD